MKRLRHLGTPGIPLLAVLVTMAGAPALACAAMPDCAMTAPAEDCHGSVSHHGCAPPTLQADEDCCGMLAAQPPVSAAPSERPGVSLAADAPLPASPWLVASPARRPAPGGAPPPSRPAGRSLLSLQQTFLI
jgi:hypothetical protein